MKSYIILIQILITGFLVTGCLKSEKITERDHSRTDSALVVIERLMNDSSYEKEIEKLKEDLERKPQTTKAKEKLIRVKVEETDSKESRKVDTLFLERTIKSIYFKKGDEMVLESVTVEVDSCFHSN
jgi:hypothetical protein